MKAVHALQYRCRVKGIQDVSDKMPGPRAKNAEIPRMGAMKEFPQRKSRRSMDAPSRCGEDDAQETTA